MGIARYLSKLASGLSSEGVLSAAKGGTGSTSGGGGSSNFPTISTIGYLGDDTATNTDGGSTVTLTGTNFNTGVKVIINGVQPATVTRVNSTQITFPAPAMAAGSYIVYVVNTDGSTALAVPGIQYSPVPTWTTAAGSLGSSKTQVSFSASVNSTGDAPITYSIVSGALPSGLTLNSSTGAITGTTPTVVAETTYNFTVRASDGQNQDTDRAFSIRIILANPPTTADFLVVAGGGASGSSTSGGGAGPGGGAGGYRTSVGTSGRSSAAESPITISAGTAYAITVGAGGVGGLNLTSTNGSDSSIVGTGVNLVSIGGGKGPGASGGSGGGGTYNVTTGGSGTTGQGWDGGNSASSFGGYASAGGGGASSSGTTGSGNTQTATGGSGGQGIQSSITGTATWYAGGGGSASFNTNGTPGYGGQGGGGNGGKGINGTPGTANTGGGAGGTGSYGTSYSGMNGGSGIVVIRYANTYDAAVSTTGSPTYLNSGGYHIYTWTNSGSITF